jgi:hypothetical protein
MLDAFRMLAHYNRIANERLYEACGRLEPVEFRRERKGSFGSIHGLLNHVLLGDRIWMSRFAGRGHTTPPLNSILFEDFSELRSARAAHDRGSKRSLRRPILIFCKGNFPTLTTRARITWRQRRSLCFISSTTRRITAPRCM